MNYLIKPLTKKMLVHLRKARAIELSGDNKICGIEDYKGTLAGLYRRGLVETKMVEQNGKELLQVYVSSPGINLLTRYEEDLKLPEAVPDVVREF